MAGRVLIAMLAATVGAPAMAESPICGGISLVGEWLGGEESASDLSAEGTSFTVEGTVPIAGHLVRMFTLSQPGAVRVEARAAPSGDPFATIFDAGGREVATDDDSAGDYGALIDTTLPTGSYCLAVRSYESRPTNVTVAVGPGDGEPAEIVPDEPDTEAGGGCFADTMATLGTLDVDGTLEADATADEVPAYGFELSEPMALTITATSTDGDPSIRLLRPDGTILAENDDFDGLDSRIEVTAPMVAGGYCVEVTDLSEGDSSITVSMQRYDAAAARAGGIGRAEVAPTAADGTEVQDLGSLGTVLTAEATIDAAARWFRIDLPDGGLVVTEAAGDGADPVLTLFDLVGRKIGENDDGPDGLDSRLVSQLPPGGYLLAVRLVDPDAVGLVRLLLQRYVPAR